MPFGIKVAPAVFQNAISGIIKRNGLSEFTANYLDDLLIFSRTFDEHLVHIQRLITAVFEDGFRFNFKKCTFAASSIQYLGHILGPDTVQPLQDNLIAIKSFPTPSSRKNIRQFLGKVNFYRKFIPDSVSILEPFHNLLRKNIPFSWSNECQRSFDKIKDLLTSVPVLAIFDRTKPIFVYTDASGVGIGAVLKQTQSDGSEKPVAYFSKKLSDAQKRKKAIYIEGIAVREAIRYWRYWLIGHHFTVVTDHKSLEGLNLKARTDEELGDLANELLQFDFEILYRPGTSNHEADCLSRNPVLKPQSDSTGNEPILPTFNFLSLDEIKQLQRNVEVSSLDLTKQGIIYRTINGNPRILLDIQAGKHLINIVHAKYGHIGPKHVIAIISKNFTFPKMYTSIREFCSSCKICIMNKSRCPRRSARMGFLGPARAPFEIMSLDTVGGFGPYHSSLRYLHLLVDHFTRYAYILPSKGQSAKIMSRFIDSVQRENQIGILLTDQYGGLSSDEFTAYCSRSGIRHVFTAVDSAFSNGLNERLNQTLVNRIRCLIHDESTPPTKSWSAIANECVTQYNDSPHSVTKFAPSYLLTGRPVSIIPKTLSPPADLHEDRKTAFENTLKYHMYNKHLYDKNKCDVNFAIGDSVYVDNGNKLNRNKLDNLRIGPFPISRVISNNVYEITVNHGPSGKRLYHASKLIRCPADVTIP
ncbi:Retrotransposon protein [Nesidiocoris tenuis]|uniref:RNA-directed DNA polymerase n=1 Tax=Nesidiocoris tenuis TaxID=355587 RepID=A0ABN7AKW2_9HEMI|nr:Retrotransposon protein [Nesidiocoris tenuis]